MASLARTSSATVLEPGDDGLEPIERAFLEWAQGYEHTNKSRLTHEQRREFKSFLNDPTRKPHGQKEQHWRQQARKKYEIVQGQLYRQPSDTIEDDPDEAAASLPRRVIMVEAAYSTIRRTHELIGPHAGVKKTWGEVQRWYYGINRNEVAWVVRNCEVCQLNTSSTNRQAPIQMIKTSNPNERWCIDLIDMRSRPYGGFCWCYHCKVRRPISTTYTSYCCFFSTPCVVYTMRSIGLSLLTFPIVVVIAVHVVVDRVSLL